MNPQQNIQRQQAWIDGELSNLEVVELEAKLSNEQLEDLKNERSFQQSLGSTLRKNAPHCPDEVWNLLIKNMKGESRWVKLTKPALFWNIAALLLIGLILFIFLKMPQTNIIIDPLSDRFAHQFDVSGDLPKIQAALQHRGFYVQLDPIYKGKHAVELLGLQFGPNDNEATLVYSCCGEPVIVMVSKRKNTHYVIAESDGHIEHVVSKNIDHFHLQAFSYHPPQEILSIIH